MMRHERHGSGPALVLIPGLAATARFFDPVVADLSRDHTVVTVDLPGHGDSPLGDGELTLRSTAGQVHEVIESLELDDVTLVGWSLGATVAWTCLAEFAPRQVRRLVSVEQTPWLLSDGGWQYAAFGSLDSTAAAGLLAGIDQDAEGFAENLVRGSFATGSEPDQAVVAELVAQARKTSATAIKSLLADVLRQDWRERVRSIRTPTLLIHGARSGVYPPEVGGWLADAFPAARLEVFEHSGHLCFLEEPERFCSTVRAFVAG